MIMFKQQLRCTVTVWSHLPLMLKVCQTCYPVDVVHWSQYCCRMLNIQQNVDCRLIFQIYHVLQENSIKLREKNLQLNQEIHTKHQECCSLKEKFSTVSTENMTLARQLAKTSQENRRLTRQVTEYLLCLQVFVVNFHLPFISVLEGTPIQEVVCIIRAFVCPIFADSGLQYFIYSNTEHRSLWLQFFDICTHAYLRAFWLEWPLCLVSCTFFSCSNTSSVSKL